MDNNTAPFLFFLLPLPLLTFHHCINGTAGANGTTSSCANLCTSTSFSSNLTVTPYSCRSYAAGENITITGGQAQVGCGTVVTPEVALCRVTLGIETSQYSSAYVEVWMPDDNSTSWNGRTMSTDNGGVDGCVSYDQLKYMTSMGFAAIGDNGGHNSSAFDGHAFYKNNQVILDWVYRSRHESVVTGKDLVRKFYGKPQSHSYYVGCSTGGQQGLHSAQHYPEDFDGIIAGASAADMNHLQAWSSRFIQLTGTGPSDPRFLTLQDWILVQSHILKQCDAAIDGVDDGILEDPTLCRFNASAIPICNSNSTQSNATQNCLNSTQIDTVNKVFTELYDDQGKLLYPALLYGSQVDAFRLGQLSGHVQGIAHDWFAYAMHNNSNFDILKVNQTDYKLADRLDAMHGYPSSFRGDLSAFKNAGKKLLMYHGGSDPLVSGANSQRYYQKVAKTMNLDNSQMDPFMRLFRVSGMAHCGVGGISGAGAWMFGQNKQAAVSGVVDNVITDMVDWVENGKAPDTLTGTKFWWDVPSLGVQFRRPHCRFPYRTTYKGSGDWHNEENWGCEYIKDWQECGDGAHPRTCNSDGSF
ncbi:putative ferulic acid Esterase/Feruloyl esterase precursor [Piedraia hortae CBS 480.64]|uniref:Carboxylic ester hydrolase n=1 Tax=Piedraia hortae CBS 480.64 TaxID=1314780 RepID=A0A6A7BZ88_9PEZI|nr:putative ferulic acid Esterase/Feruloyl esterase precursor [Piedraia hortae CBS 480.64]